ncbi:cleavage and polyadenylation specific factor 5 [Trichodelitschia bisporula]|uniref:Cleavage and polyadenylation specific factor 5 n=1 Tax=Trichodelitschia bisporula TaxID=703511 RepID=A0A6G1I495_9PEZI|nr:cleavage and polyadenylation specific factor 5 [Trichodelitschia bisporula]
MSTIPLNLLKSSNPPIIPLPFDANQPPTIRLYPFSRNEISTKAQQPEEDASVEERLLRLKNHYEQHGMRRFCEGVMLCHEHNHPHVMLLQIANSFHKLPGGWLRHDEPEIEGFQRVLDELFEPEGTQTSTKKWEIGDTLGQWWRPNFETSLYPYLPVHVTRPKECKKMYIIPLPQQKVIAVPKNLKFLAIPFYELYENAQAYGPQLAALPHYLARYNFEYVDEHGNVVAMTPAGMPSSSPPERNNQDQNMADAGQGQDDQGTNGANQA